ncbi:MAG TPA: hypothetical protein VF294_15170, partial [Polyangiaceae bacterium]
MPSVRLLSLVALGTSAFSSCSAGEFARPAPERSGQSARPVATLSIPAPPVAPRAMPVAPLPRVEPAVAATPAPDTSADVAPDEEDEPTPSSARDEEPVLDPDRLLVAIARETLIYEQPSFKATKIGYLRAGAQVRRDAQPAGHEGCKGGFYRIMPEGYVCVGATATLDPNHPVAQFGRVRPDRSSALPYRYGRSIYPTPPFYTRLPSKLEQEQEEVELARHLEANTRAAWRDAPTDPTPQFLAAGGQAPTPFGYAHEANKLTNGRAVTDSSFALLAIYDQGGRRFGLSTDMSLLPLDRMKPVVASTFHGIALGGEVQLPVVFVRNHNAFLYSGSPSTGFAISRPLGFREALPVTGRSRSLAGLSYLETTSGDW